MGQREAGTQVYRSARGEGGTIIISISLYLDSYLVPQDILVTAPELQEDWMGTITFSYCSLGLLMSSSV